MPLRKSALLGQALDKKDGRPVPSALLDIINVIFDAFLDGIDDWVSAQVGHTRAHLAPVRCSALVRRQFSLDDSSEHNSKPRQDRVIAP